VHPAIATQPAESSSVDGLIKGRQYDLLQAQKQEVLLPLLQDLCSQMSANCEAYGRFLRRLGPPASDWRSLADIPALPVTMFKQFELRGIPPQQVVRELRSSSTTGSSPSRIFIDKTTAFRQARALISLLKEDIGSARRPYLVLDAPESAQAGDQLTARGAAIRGIGNFASSTTFAFRLLPGGDLEPDIDALQRFFAEHADEQPLLFGFTFIVWSRFLLEMEKIGLRFDASGATLLHSGGWKKLLSQAVGKDVFTGRMAQLLGCRQESILDFYGMVEQVGTVFVDCSQGHKHAPAFADVILRAPHTLAPVGIGQEGLIEVLSVLPSSYPGHALLTEDLGMLMGVDDCLCGRKGSYFRFTKRVERTEIRGCGDTFAQSRQLRGQA
jgi:hypothetical protein